MNGGKLTVEYEVISSAAQKRIDKMQKSINSLGKAAEKQVDDLNKLGGATEKQAKLTQVAYKKLGKTVIAFGAVVTGALYGIVRSSAYASMWMDQIGHQTTRIMTELSEMLGLDDAITAFIEILKNVADELIMGEENKFWENLLNTFDNLSTKGKIVGGVIATLAAVTTVIAAGFGLIAFDSLLVGLGLISAKGVFTAAVMGKLAGALVILKAGFIAIVGSIGAITLIVVAIAAAFVYLWSKTDHGIAQIESLKNVWNNFKSDIKDVGWLKAIGTALGNLGTIIFFEISTWVKQIPEVIKYYLSTGLLGKVLTIGKNIIIWLISGLDKMFPGFKTWFYNLATETINRLNYIKDRAFEKGKEIINRLIDGIDSKLPGFKYIISHYTNIFNSENDKMIIKARETSNDIVNEYVGGFNQKEIDLALQSYRMGQTIKDETLSGVGGLDIEIDAEMQKIIDGVSTGVIAINTELGKIETSIDINLQILKGDISDTARATITAANAAMKAGEYVGGDFGTSIKSSSMPGGGDWGGIAPTSTAASAADIETINKIIDSATSSRTRTTTSSKTGYFSKGGSYSASATAGRPDYAASGAHVVQSGAVIAHQGEDIVHLKSLLSGIKESGNSSNITINPVININSSGRMNDPIETNRIADIVSKKMADELRRISTNF